MRRKPTPRFQNGSPDRMVLTTGRMATNTETFKEKKNDRWPHKSDVAEGRSTDGRTIYLSRSHPSSFEGGNRLGCRPLSMGHGRVYGSDNFGQDHLRRAFRCFNLSGISKWGRFSRCTATEGWKKDSCHPIGQWSVQWFHQTVRWNGLQRPDRLWLEQKGRQKPIL